MNRSNVVQQFCRVLMLSALFLTLDISRNASASSGCADEDTQTGMNQCSSIDVDMANGAIQAVYDRLRADLGAEGKIRVRDAQRAWIQYRDAWCKFESMAVERGSMYPSVYAACLVRLTRDQTDKLTYQLTCTDNVVCARSAD